MSDQLAHDLKNPLAAMHGAIQLLQEERRRGHSLDERAELIELVDEQIKRMMRVIEKYRRLGRIEPEESARFTRLLLALPIVVEPADRRRVFEQTRVLVSFTVNFS